MTPDPAAKLSELQRHILRLHFELWPDRFELYGQRHGSWGIPMLATPPDSTASDAASYSRALKRLEARGLILRQNIVSGDPTRTRP